MLTPLVVTEESRRSRVATALLLVALAEGALAAVAGTASGVGWQRLADLLVVTNILIGVALALSGWPIAHQQPRNPVGWYLLSAGVAWASTGAGAATLAWAVSQGQQDAAMVRVLATVVNLGGWGWALSTLVPLALLSFPDGRLLGRGWRAFVGIAVANGLLVTVAGVLDPRGGLAGDVGVSPSLRWLDPQPSAGLLAVWTAGVIGGYAGALAALVLRYRKGGDVVRRQVLWLLLAVLVVACTSTLEALLDTQSFVLGILPILLVPVSIAVAILRHELVDIRLVVSRSVLYVVLTGLVVAAYLGVVAILDQTVRGTPLGSSVLATVLVALAVNPVRVWLQGLVHRAFYGARDDPVRAFAAVGARLQEVGTDLGPGLEGVLEALCRALRLPAAAIVTDGRTVAARGSLPADRHAVTLPGVGELVVGVRSGDRRLGTDDERVLDLLAAPLTVAVQAERLADELRSSRERVVTGREEERRRIRRDLHDGLGPVLTGIVLNADTALRLLPTQPDRSAALLADLRTHAMRAIDEIRRVAYDLRPPVLDGMGVVGAIREYAAVLGRPEGGTELTVTVEAPEDGWPVLPAAVEVATYRIVTEALTNVVRHSSATAVTVRLEPDGPVLRLEVLDNGINAGPSWEPGVGLTSVRERTAELGGASELRYDRTGGQVRVTLPIGAAQTTPSGPFADQATS